MKVEKGNSHPQRMMNRNWWNNGSFFLWMKPKSLIKARQRGGSGMHRRERAHQKLEDRYLCRYIRDTKKAQKIGCKQ